MSIADIENYDPSKYFYNLKDKIFNHIVKRSEDCFRKAEETRNSIQAKEELFLHTEKMRAYFIESIGGIPYDRSLPLSARITGTIEEDDLRIEKVIFESRPGVYVTVNLYLPNKRKDKCGAVLFQIGHSEYGKAYSQYQKVARCIASAGLIVLVMDPIGQGERLSYYEYTINRTMVGACTAEHQYAGEQCVLLGDNIARYFICDAMKAVDYLISRPEVDSAKIGATGSSGGGTMTSYLMVCDDRIIAAAPGTFIMNRREYLYAGGAQDSEQIWMGATEAGFDHNELLLCFAPKPLLILTVDTDFFPLEGSKAVFEESKRFWEMFGAKEKLNFITDKSEHAYTDSLAQQAAKFFAKELNGEDIEVHPHMMKSLEPKDLNCTQTGQVATDFNNAKFIFDENKARYHELQKYSNTFNVKSFLREKVDFGRMPCDLNIRTFSPLFENGLKIQPLLWFPQKQMPNFGLLFSHLNNLSKKSKIIICLWANGTNDIENNIYFIREVCKRGDMPFVVDLSAMGKCSPYPLHYAYNDKVRYGVLDRLTKNMFFLNDSLCALRLFDLEKAIEMIKSSTRINEVSVYAKGICSAYARLFALLHSSVNIQIEHGVSDYKIIVSEKYYEDYNISGILLPALLNYLP